MNDRDYQRFLQTIYYYQFTGPKPKFSNQKRFRSKDFDKNPKIVEIHCYCLMPNHFHLVIKQLKDNGIQEFLSKAINSYTKYFNTKHNRVGPLFQGQFKAILVETEEQLLHLSRYIHLNPYVADITDDWETFPYSSINEFITAQPRLCNLDTILGFFNNPQDYKIFIKDYEGYASELTKIKHLLLDPE